jgi:hypothetical protein
MRKTAIESIKDGKANVGLFSKYKSDNTVKVLDLSRLDWIQEIGAATFMGFSYVEEIKLPNGVKMIGDMVFSNCGKLKKVEIPKTVTSLGDWVFTKCPSLTKISIPASVVDCGCYIFSRCTKLKEVIIDKSRQEVKERWDKQWNGDTEKDLRVKFKEDVERERAEAKERERIEME